MKLLFPIFASLVLHYQVNTEGSYHRQIRKTCLNGYGRCKDQCNADEKEVQKCRKKKCCIGPKRLPVPPVPPVEREEADE
ncbi:beta-defensin 129 [Erethizon dorsatum]